MDRRSYSFLLYLLSPLIWLYFLQRGYKDSRYLKNLKQRLGLFDSNVATNGLHIHCASMGETLAAAPLIIQFVKKYPDLAITISSTTPTGKAEALKLIKKLNQTNIQHCYLPIDWSGSCKRFIKRIQPKLTILMETELWPNLLNELSKEQIPVLLANARMSESSLKKYLKYPKLSSEIFSNISIIAAQYESDGLNFQTLGADKDRVKLTGNIKFDIQISAKLIEQQKRLKQDWTHNRPCWIAASIHPGEFDFILNSHMRLLKKIPNLLLIGVPRHPERFDDFKKACQHHQLNYISRTDNQLPTDDHSVIVGDTMGELLLFYGVADIAFIGGSLIPRGGHNPIEAAACRLPVIIGDSYFNFSDVTFKMQQDNSLERIFNENDLTDIIKKTLSDPKLLNEKSEASRKVLESNKGAVEKIIQHASQLIN